MSLYLGIDIGGTASRFALIDDANTIIVRGKADGATGHLFNPVAHETFVRVIGEIGQKIAPYGDIAFGVVGVTGLGGNAISQAKEILTHSLKLQTVDVTDDMELAYRCAFAPGEGHLISAGTGSVGLHVTKSGEIIRVGGRGILIDDGGSGSWIALRALDLLYRRIDETGDVGDARILADKLFTKFGGNTWDATRAYIYGVDRGLIGQLAQLVGEAANEGDPLARQIASEAAIELARLGIALVKRTQKQPIGYVGGLLSIASHLKPELEKALAGYELIFPQLDVALTASYIAHARAEGQKDLTYVNN